MQIAANFFFLSTSYLLVAIGLALVFGVMRVVNYAHGELYMIGGYVLWACITLMLGKFPSPLILLTAVVLAAVITGILGIVIQKGIVAGRTDRPFAIFMATLGVSYILQVLVIQTIGPVGRSLPPLFPGIIRIYGAVLPLQRIVVACAALTLMGGIWYFLMRTKSGRAIRAAAQNERGAMLQGVSMTMVGVLTMVISASVAGIAGVLSASILGVTPFVGVDAIWKSFLVVIVGGVGSISGAILAACLFGALETALTTLGYAQYIAMTDAVIMLLILTFLPYGLRGEAE